MNEKEFQEKLATSMSKTEKKKTVYSQAIAIGRSCRKSCGTGAQFWLRLLGTSFRFWVLHKTYTRGRKINFKTFLKLKYLPNR